jgi:hypothetical protein
LGKFDFSNTCDNILIPDLNMIKNISNEFQWRLDAVEIYDWIGLASIQAQRYLFKKTIHIDLVIDLFLSIF